MSQIVLYFLHDTSVLLFHMVVVLAPSNYYVEHAIFAGKDSVQQEFRF